MSQFCKNCGSLIDDNELFCNNCGTQDVAACVKVKKSKVVASILIVVSVAIVVLCIAFFSGIFSNKRTEDKISEEQYSYNDVLDCFIDVGFEGEIDGLQDLAPQEYWNVLEDKRGMDFDEYKEIYEVTLKEQQELREDKYGKDVVVRFNENEKGYYSESNREKIVNAINEEYGIEKNLVEDVIIVKGEWIVEGSKNKRVSDGELKFVAIDGKWYMIKFYYTDTIDFGVDFATSIFDV